MQRQLPDIGPGRRGAAADAADFIDGEIPSRRDPIRWLVGCGILLIAAIAIGTAIMVGNFRDHALESSKRELENTVLLLAHHFDQQLEDAEVPLTHLIAQIHQAGIDTPADFTRQMSTPEMHLLLKAKVGSGFSKIAGVNVYDAAGDLINSSEVAVVPAVNIADRAYFKALKASSEAERPQIELVRSRFTGGWRTLITRKVTGQDGEFLGVVSRAITPAKFEEFFSSVALGKDATISMHHHEGALIARYPHVEEIIGKNFKAGSTPQAAFLSLDHGTARLISPVDGEERLVSVRSLSQFPLSVLATTTVASALADWRTQTRFMVVVAGLSAIVVAIILVLIVRRLSWQHLLSRRRLMLEKQRLDTAVDNMTQGLTLFNQSRQLIVCNQRYIEMYGLSPDTVKPGCNFRDLIAHRIEVGSLHVDDLDAHCARILELVARGEGIIINAPDGRSIQVTHRLLPDGGWVATHEDITERQRAEAEIVYLARHDVLTGLANRAEFNAKLEEASKRIRRNGGAVTVMMLDLDKFKAVNDTLGHPAGDQLLIEVGRRLQSTIRETDVLARLGGDEFAIIQEGGPDQHEGAIALALRIINAITQPFDLNGNQASVGTSIGIVLAPEHDIDPEGLLKRADLALYDAKANGRNDFRVFRPEMLDVAHTQQSAESELRNAIARNEFELHYQPVVDIKTRLLCGVEALVRWKHPAKGLIAPDQFIPLAESTGLIAQLGEWILQRACADAASWPAHVKVAVNISAVQFRKGNLFEVILCTLVETGLAPERLELEVTETALLENQEAHLTTIRQLKNLGVCVALDDFGTGYSSVSYLTNFPFDKIKIDKSFTQGVLHRRDCKAVVASTLALANGLGTLTTAEGVETEEQLEYMREAGVDLVQGYLFGRPVPIAQLDLHNSSMPKEKVA
jgi:diguanylate cyclase (GGDEF)-like protein